MAQLTNKEYERQIDEVINIVNENHDKYMKEQERLQEAGNRGINAKMKKVLNRIIGAPEVVTKKEIIYFSLDNDRLIIKNSEGDIIGYTTLSQKLQSKIELVNKKPIFQLIRGNEVYLERDVLSGRMKSHAVGKGTFKQISRAYTDSKEMLDEVKYIYELIENKNYEAIDSFIIYSMEELINNNLETASIEQHQIYIETYVANQRIHRLKAEINEREQQGKNYETVLNMLDNEYRLVCQKLINAGLYKMPLNR